MHRLHFVTSLWAMPLGVLLLASPAFAQTDDSPPSEETPAAAEPAAEPTADDEGADAGGEDATEAQPADVEPADEPAPEGPEDAGPATLPTDPADEGGYNFKLRAIQERVNELKEKIFQSKARLIQLQEVVLHGTISGAKALLVHRNEMGSSFRLWRVQYALDGAPIFNRVDAGDGLLNDQEEIEIFNGSIAPGNHTISVFLEYHGHGYGIFSYLKGYKFKIKSSYTFTAEEGKVTTVNVVGYEEGGITTQLKDRPSVRYDIETTRELRRNQEAGENEGGSEASE